jgi:hypothetical protein
MSDLTYGIFEELPLTTSGDLTVVVDTYSCASTCGAV